MMLSKISAYVVVRAWKMKEAMKTFWEEERGNHMVEVILVLVVVVALALVFRENITKIVSTLWESINKSVEDVNVDTTKEKLGVS